MAKIKEEEYLCIENLPSCFKKTEIKGLPIVYKVQDDKPCIGKVVSLGRSNIVIDAIGYKRNRHHNWKDLNMELIYLPIGLSITDALMMEDPEGEMSNDELYDKVKVGLLLDKALFNNLISSSFSSEESEELEEGNVEQKA